jgi:hypothetical protein
VLAGPGAGRRVGSGALDPAVATLPGVEIRRASAFALDPAAIGPVDWLFSDVICYPARLLALVERWLAAGLARNFVCTLKFQGETDLATAGRFAEVPVALLLHRHPHKREITCHQIVEAEFDDAAFGLLSPPPVPRSGNPFLCRVTECPISKNPSKSWGRPGGRAPITMTPNAGPSSSGTTKPPSANSSISSI